MARPLNWPVLAPPEADDSAGAALDEVEDGSADHSEDDAEETADQLDEVGIAAAWTAELGAPATSDVEEAA